MLLTAWTLTLHTMYHSHIVTNICDTDVHCVSKKAYPLIFDNNFGICGPIFKIVSLMIRMKILCIHHKDFHLTCSMLLHYLVKVENPKKNVIVFSRWM